MSALSTPIALIFGAGKNTGAGVARAFAANGYKIATVSRTAAKDTPTDQQIHIQGDVTDPKSISDVFSTVRKHFGEPSVVIYNAAALTFTSKDDPLKLPVEDVIRDTNINTFSVYAAAKEAVVSFETLSKDASRTFIYTGNILNTTVMAPLLTLGVGKTATSHIIQAAASAYSDHGYKFYYADQRNADGSSVGTAIDGEAHGEFYVELAEKKSPAPWQATFVKGTGYVAFK